MSPRSCLIIALLSVLLHGCSTVPEDPEERAEYEKLNDPIEPLNRYFFEVSQFLDFLLLRPLADTYIRVVPQPVKNRVSNVLGNAGEPPIFLNALLQGRVRDSVITLGRFTLNSTLGVFGLFDVASQVPLEKQFADMGQTLHTYGVGEGPYLYLPVLGPSSVRDTSGFILGQFLNDPVDLGLARRYDLSIHKPLGINQQSQQRLSYGRTVLGGVNFRSQIFDQYDTIFRFSIDPYSQLRSLSRQLRRSQLGITAPETTAPEGDPFSDDPFSDDPFSDDPFSDDPFSDDPFSDDPFSDDPFSDDPFSDDPFSDDPFSDDPFSDDPFSDDPFSDDPLSDDTDPL